MKISTATLSFLVLATVLGSQAHESRAHDSLALEASMVMPAQLNGHIQGGFHHPAECCLSYTPRKVRCVFMKDYFETASGCSRPGVVFVTKRGQQVCANPLVAGVQDCIMHLKVDSLKKLLKNAEEEKRYN